MSDIRRLVSLGQVMIDITAHVDRLPERGSDILASESDITPGGGFNTMVAAVRQGLPTAYAGTHGTGPFGDLARQAMHNQGIKILLPPTPGADTSYDVAIIDAGGERTFITVLSDQLRLTPEQLAHLALRAGDAVHVSGYGLLEQSNGAALESWLAERDHDHLVIFDPGPLALDIAPARLAIALKQSDWISCNEREAELITAERKPSRAADALSRDGGGVLVRLGPAGCLVRPVGGESVVVAGFATEVADTNGAGDAHVGAFVAALAAGLDPVEAGRRANACAAIAVSRRGPATAPTLTEVEDLLRKS